MVDRKVEVITEGPAEHVAHRLAALAMAGADLNNPGETVGPNQSVELAGMTITFGDESTEHRLETPGVIGLTDVEINNLSHLSFRHIERFENGKGTGVVSKHGPGTYVAAGDLGGDNLKVLRSSEHWAHDLTFKGNALLVPFEQQFDASWEIAERILGDDIDEVSSNPGATINRLLREHELDGVTYDGFFLYTNPDTKRQMTEGIIMDPEKSITIVGVERVEPTA